MTKNWFSRLLSKYRQKRLKKRNENLVDVYSYMFGNWWINFYKKIDRYENIWYNNIHENIENIENIWSIDDIEIIKNIEHI